MAKLVRAGSTTRKPLPPHLQHREPPLDQTVFAEAENPVRAEEAVRIGERPPGEGIAPRVATPRARPFGQRGGQRDGVVGHAGESVRLQP